MSNIEKIYIKSNLAKKKTNTRELLGQHITGQMHFQKHKNNNTQNKSTTV